MSQIFPTTVCKHSLRVKPKALFDTIATFHDGKDYRLKRMVWQFRDSFEGKELDEVLRIQGLADFGDDLTEYNQTIHHPLSIILTRSNFEGFNFSRI